MTVVGNIIIIEREDSGMDDEDGATGPTFAQSRVRAGPSTTPVSVRLPEPLLERLDGAWAEQGLESRSAFVRQVLAAVAENPDAADALLDDDR